jgi:hypothetical protein
MTEINSINSGRIFYPSQLGRAARFIPEPKNRVSEVLTSAVKGALDTVASTTGIDNNFAGLLNKQVEIQVQMQTLSMESNIERSNHETKMTPIRNARLG